MPNIEVLESAVAVANLPVPAPREVLLVSPLEVAFSQNVINPHFSDGRSVDETVRRMCAAITAAAASDEAGAKQDELLLEPPFPRMEAVRWCPKLRDGSGTPLLDDRGEQRRGVEGLFSVDNRRLYTLQRVAVTQHPRRCVVAVDVITDKVEVLRHLKKFRTRTNGLSITVSQWSGIGRDNAKIYSAIRVWDWRSAVSSAGDEEEGHSGSGRGLEAASAVAIAGSCGCWEYLDRDGVRRGPFSNWQMRRWWERRMLPPSLQIRPYDAAGTIADKRAAGPTQAPEGPAFRLVSEVFEGAPCAFAAGWSPRTTDQEMQAQRCAECRKKRFDGWEAHGQWYCAACWKKWGACQQAPQRPDPGGGK